MLGQEKEIAQNQDISIENSNKRLNLCVVPGDLEAATSQQISVCSVLKSNNRTRENDIKKWI